MKLPLRFFTLITVLLFTIPASAGTVFDAYPINGNIEGRTIGPPGFGITNPFTLPNPATLTGVNFGAWLDPGATITNIGWLLGTSAFGSDIASGYATPISHTFFASSLFNDYDIDSVSFTFPDVNVAAGSYWLTLQSVAATGGGWVYWDVTSNTGSAIQSGSGWTGANAFQILGNSAAAAAPEPASFLLLATGLAAALVLRRKLSRS